MQFSKFSKAVTEQFQAMAARGLYRVNVEKDLLWDTYLNSFPAGTNPIYKERTEHDCQCCKSFIRAVGGLVAIENGKLISIWDVLVDDEYQVVADSMGTLIKSCAIDNAFLHTEPVAGLEKNLQLLESGEVLTWNHFFVKLPASFVVRGEQIGPKGSETRSTHDVFLRSLKELSVESVQSVLELVEENTLYKGQENKFALETFAELQGKFHLLTSDLERDLFAWTKSANLPGSVTRIRNTAIGTLLIALSSGEPMQSAQLAYENVVAPTNYKRPTALVTASQIKKAQETIEELGFTSALERRFANIDDIRINNILFANRETKKAMNVFDELSAKVAVKAPKTDAIEKVTIEQFLAGVLPTATSLEILFENRLSGNLVSLIAPVDPAAKNMFKWNNNFSWSYVGEVTDSIKERVKTAGGKVDGDFRASLSWYNYDDLDLHLEEPDGNEIYFGAKISHHTHGQLDVDMNAGGQRSRSAVENIFYPDRKKMRPGQYRLFVNNFNKHETKDEGFEVEIEFDGVIHSFHYPNAVKARENVEVAKFSFTQKDGVVFTKSLPSSQASRTVWGAATQTYQKVNVVMMSPNHWDGLPVGNKHYFFMLDQVRNEGKTRGFFNEFLTGELDPHRKVFEMVGAKLKTEESDRQLSGLGFSSTLRNNVIARIDGGRTVKITF
jgi:hypothetical protein